MRKASALSRAQTFFFHSISKCSTEISRTLVFELQISDLAYIFDLMFNDCDRKYIACQYILYVSHIEPRISRKNIHITDSIHVLLLI
jgi:hypothetical protein